MGSILLFNNETVTIAMARTLLVVPPLPERSYPGKFMGLDYLAAALLAHKHQVKILDLDIHYMIKKDVLTIYKDALAEFRPDLVGITNMSIQNDIGNYIAWVTKRVMPETIVVKGGFHEITGYVYTLQLHHNYVDACVVGEGEMAIQKIAGAIDAGEWERKKTEISGVAYWDGSKPVLTSGHREEVDPNLLSPARVNWYPEYNFRVLGNRKTAQMMTVRGCPFECAFCSEAFFPARTHWRDLSNIIKELDQLRKDRYEAIYFDDSTFTLKPDRIFELMKEVHKRGFVWGCNTRVDVLKREMVKAMGENGCVYLFCGVESLVPEILLGMNKTHKPSHYLDCVPRVYRWLREAKISPSVFLIFGNARMDASGTLTPEKWEDVEYTIKSAIDLDTDYISMNILRFLPEVAFSQLSHFAPIRPTGHRPVHAGHYDLKWYMLNGCEDLRSRHPVYRCFEGSRSVNPGFATPEYAYAIMEKAIELVNQHNLNSSRQVKIVVDYRARDFFHKESIAGVIQYRILPFHEIPVEVESIPLLEEWREIVKQDLSRETGVMNK